MKVEHHPLNALAILHWGNHFLRECCFDLFVTAWADAGLGMVLCDLNGNLFGKIENLTLLNACVLRASQTSLTMIALPSAPIQPVILNVVGIGNLVERAALVPLLCSRFARSLAAIASTSTSTAGLGFLLLWFVWIVLVRGRRLAAVATVAFVAGKFGFEPANLALHLVNF